MLAGTAKNPQRRRTDLKMWDFLSCCPFTLHHPLFSFFLSLCFVQSFSPLYIVSASSLSPCSLFHALPPCFPLHIPLHSTETFSLLLSLSRVPYDTVQFPSNLLYFLPFLPWSSLPPPPDTTLVWERIPVGLQEYVERE